jgi:acyl-CoA reductase-like NAD-dependent aldehyde dehydrogenase
MLLEKNLIGGNWSGGSEGLEIRNPSDLTDTIGVYGLASKDDVEAAVSAARKAQPAWGQTTIENRSLILDVIARSIFDNKNRLARILAREGGKTVPDALGEVVRAGHIARFFAGEALRMPGEKLGSVRPNVDVEVTRDPVGVVGPITPWNFPIATPMWKIAPALAFGNAVVWKPSEKTPGISVAIAEIVAGSGIPTGVFNMIIGRGHDVGAAVIAKADAISFTGSLATGRRIAIACAERLIRCQMEMGGKNPLVVLDDANVDLAADIAVNGAFFQQGQRCTASSRLIVTNNIHDAFVKACVERISKLRVGNALKPDTQIGPVIDDAQFNKNLSYIESAKSDNALLAIGGTALELENKGYYLAPTLFSDTSNSMRINREEVFGPVATVIRVANYEEALEVANNTEYGLSAGIVTTSMKYARHFQRNVDAGMTMLNLPTAGVDYHTPFGGRKLSSYGQREQGRYAVEFYTQIKTSYLSV